MSLVRIREFLLKSFLVVYVAVFVQNLVLL